MIWPGSSSSWWTIPFQSHQTLSITFLSVNTGFPTVCEASPGFDHDLFRTFLSYVIHFSSPVTIRLKNGSILFRFSSDSQTETRSINFSLLIRVEPKYQASFGIQSYVNGSKLFYGRLRGDVARRNMSVDLNFSKNFIGFFNDWPARARFIFNIEISGTKTSKPILTLAFT